MTPPLEPRLRSALHRRFANEITLVDGSSMRAEA
jgi:hypothetical protein